MSHHATYTIGEGNEEIQWSDTGHETSADSKNVLSLPSEQFFAEDSILSDSNPVAPPSHSNTKCPLYLWVKTKHCEICDGPIPVEIVESKPLPSIDESWEVVVRRGQKTQKEKLYDELNRKKTQDREDEKEASNTRLAEDSDDVNIELEEANPDLEPIVIRANLPDVGSALKNIGASELVDVPSVAEKLDSVKAEEKERQLDSTDFGENASGDMSGQGLSGSARRLGLSTERPRVFIVRITDKKTGKFRFVRGGESFINDQLDKLGLFYRVHLRRKKTKAEKSEERKSSLKSEDIIVMRDPRPEWFGNYVKRGSLRKWLSRNKGKVGPAEEMIRKALALENFHTGDVLWKEGRFVEDYFKEEYLTPEAEGTYFWKPRDKEDALKEYLNDPEFSKQYFGEDGQQLKALRVDETGGQTWMFWMIFKDWYVSERRSVFCLCGDKTSEVGDDVIGYESGKPVYGFKWKNHGHLEGSVCSACGCSPQKFKPRFHYVGPRIHGRDWTPIDVSIARPETLTSSVHLTQKARRGEKSHLVTHTIDEKDVTKTGPMSLYGTVTIGEQSVCSKCGLEFKVRTKEQNEGLCFKCWISQAKDWYRSNGSVGVA